MSTKSRYAQYRKGIKRCNDHHEILVAVISAGGSVIKSAMNFIYTDMATDPMTKHEDRAYHRRLAHLEAQAIQDAIQRRIEHLDIPSSRGGW